MKINQTGFLSFYFFMLKGLNLSLIHFVAGPVIAGGTSVRDSWLSGLL